MENFSKLVEYFLKLVMHLEFNSKGTTSALRFTNTSPTFFHSPAFFVFSAFSGSNVSRVSLVKSVIKRSGTE